MKITLVHQGALGDTVLLVPLFKTLRQKLGELRITIVTRPNLGQMLMMLGFVEAWESAEDRAHTMWFAPAGEGTANSKPPWANCDLLISAISNGHDAWAANAKHAVRAGTKILFFEPRPPADYAGHVTHWHRGQLRELDLPDDTPLPLLRSNPDGAIVIHPGSGGEAKCWPRDRFLHLGRDLKRNGILPTFILGEAEQERWSHKVVQDLQAEFPWYLHMGLYELADRMGRARLYVGNDSGVTHLAAMMGVPVIALFGPSDDRQWGPVGSRVKILRGTSPRDLETLSEDAVLAEMLAELRRLD